MFGMCERQMVRAIVQSTAFAYKLRRERERMVQEEYGLGVTEPSPSSAADEAAEEAQGVRHRLEAIGFRVGWSLCERSERSIDCFRECVPSNPRSLRLD
jgi:hypothetical protein